MLSNDINLYDKTVYTDALGRRFRVHLTNHRFAKDGQLFIGCTMLWLENETTKSEKLFTVAEFKNKLLDKKKLTKYIERENEIQPYHPHTLEE